MIGADVETHGRGPTIVATRLRCYTETVPDIHGADQDDANT